VHDGDAKERLDVDVVGMWFKRIPEEDDHVDTSLGDGRPDLLITAERPGEEPVHGEPQLVRNHRPGRARAEEVVTRQGVAVETRPLEHVRLLVVVGDEHDLLSLGA
jgi:hypothetical protein